MKLSSRCTNVVNMYFKLCAYIIDIASNQGVNSLFQRAANVGVCALSRSKSQKSEQHQPHAIIFMVYNG